MGQQRTNYEVLSSQVRVAMSEGESVVGSVVKSSDASHHGMSPYHLMQKRVFDLLITSD